MIFLKVFEDVYGTVLYPGQPWPLESKYNIS